MPAGFLPPVVAVLTASISEFEAKMGEARTQMATTQATAGKLSAIGKYALLGMATAAGVVAVASVHLASNFDAAMELIHTQAGASQAEVESLKNSVLGLAGQVAQTPDELAKGLYHIESAGFRGAQALSMLTEAAKGATIGQADLESVTQAMIGTMAVGLKDVHGSADAMAYLNTIVGIGDMRMSKLAASIATGVLPSFRSAGLGMADYGAALATLTDNVTPADEAATRLRMTVALMAAPSGKATKALAEIGLSSIQLANDMRKPDGLLVAVMDLKTHLEASGKTAAEQNQIIEHAFGGGRSSGAILTLIEESDRLASKYKALGTEASRSAAYQEAWKAAQQQFQVQVHQLAATLEALGVKIGNWLIPKLQGAAQWTMQVVGWFERHRTVAEALGIAIGSVLVVAIAAYTVAMAQAAVETIVATWPVLAILAAVALLAVGIYELASHWRTVWSFVQRIASDVAGAVVGAWRAVKDRTLQYWGDITRAVSGAWQAIARFFVAGWHAVTDPIVAAWQWVENTTVTIWNHITEFFKTWWPLLLLIFLPPVFFLLAIWNHWHTQIIAVAKTAWAAVTLFFKVTWRGIQVAASAAWTAIQWAIVHPIEWVWHRLETLWGAIHSGASGIWSRISSAASAAWGLIRTYIVNPIQHAYSDVAGLFDRIAKAVKDKLHGLVDALKDIGKWFADIGKWIVEGIVHGIEAGAHFITDAVNNALHSALNGAKHLLGISSPSRVMADEVGNWIPAGVAAGVYAQAHQVHAAMGALLGPLASTPVPFAPTSARLPGTFGAQGGGAVVNNYNITVQGSVLAERELLAIVRQGAQKYARNNVSTGLVGVRQ